MPTVNKPKTRAATADRHEPRSRVCTSCHKLPRFCDCAPGAEPTCPICHNVMSSGQHFPDIQTCLTAEQVAAGRTGAVAVNEARFSQPLRRDVSKPLTWCGLGAVILSHIPPSLECGAVEKSPDNGYWLRLTTSDEYDFIVDIEWRSGVLSMAEIDEGGEVFEAMKTRRAKIDESEIGPTVAGWLAEMIAEMKE